MARIILFEGKVTLAGMLVDFRIYRHDDEEVPTYYSFDINPEVRDVNQAGFHNGATKMAQDLDTLLSRFRNFQGNFSQIAETRINPDF